jgi:PAS domain S-box-containing protein
VRDDENRIHSVRDLAGRRVAVMEGDNAEEYLRRRETEFDLTLFPTFREAIDAVAAGDADAVVMQRLVALRLLRDTGIGGVRLVGDPIADFRQDFCFAVPEGERELLAILNEGLALVIADGTFRRLQTEWFASMDLPGRRVLIGGDYNYPPFEYPDENGRPAGYNVDLARSIADELDIPIEIRLGPWRQTTEMLARGEIDLILGMMYSPERDRVFGFSQAHTVHHHVAVGLGGSPAGIPSTPGDLHNARIVVQEGDVMHGYARQHGLEDSLSLAESQEDALRQVVTGEADYALVGRITAMHLIARNGWDDLVVGRDGLASHEYGFAVREGNEALLSYFSEGLALTEESGEYRRIYDAWLGVYEPAGQTAEETVRTIALVLLPVLLVLFGTILWNRSLRREVSRATADLKKSESRYRLLSENTLDIVWLVSSDLQIQYVNPAVEALTGRPRDEWIGRDVGELFGPDARRRLTDGVEGRVSGDATGHEHGTDFRFQAAVPTVGGETSEVGVSGRIVWNSDGRVNTFQGVARDTTERNRYERTLTQSLSEKETLLKEIHHRVKNNLNVIVSLLRLQEDHVDDVESARVAFRESRNRIFSMALVHEALYQSENLAEIELDGYLRDLIEQLRENAPHHLRISYRLDLVPLKLDVARAVPCGIIVNELVTNAQKHAFPERESGEIAILLQADAPTVDAGTVQVTLTVADDGEGLTSEYDPEKTSSLGLKLVSILVEQINATWSMENRVSGGTRAVVRFEVNR